MDEKMLGMAASALKNVKKPAPKSKLRMHITPTDNDRFVVDHDSTGPEMMDAPARQQHSLNDVDELVEHIKKNYGKKADKSEKGEKEVKEDKANAANDIDEDKERSAEWAAVKTQVPAHNPAH